MQANSNEDSASQAYLIERLEQPSLFSEYACVKVLLIYWQDSEKFEEYSQEAKRLGLLFDESFGFDVQYYVIPLVNSHHTLRNYVDGQILGLETRILEGTSPSLLIIHYGGHGDKDDDIHHSEGRQERRSVWRAYRSGGPVVKWYEIQQLFGDVEFDVLLLFDCCYAAQAGRGREHIPGRVELLAASGEDTPGPGDGSFTAGLINAIQANLKIKGHVRISDLHRDLVHRRADLYAIPFYVRLRSGSSEGSVKLQPLREPDERHQIEAAWKSSVRLLVRTSDSLNTMTMDKIIRWLRTDKPSNINLRVESVLGTTASIQTFIRDTLPNKSTPLVKPLDAQVLSDVRHIWNAIQSLISRYVQQHDDLSSDDHATFIAQRMAKEFLEQVDAENANLLDIFQQAILLSRDYSQPHAIDAALKDPASDQLQIKDHLRLRRIICQGEQQEWRYTEAARDFNVADTGLVSMEEVKLYGSYQSASQIDAIIARVELLAALMKANKPDAFRSLPLIKWEHQRLRHRFVYQFRVPEKYYGKPISLLAIMRTTSGLARPTLDERFTMAFRLAKAVEQWHNVDWVHQGICAQNVIFFQLRKEDRVDFSFPFLQGFDFSRPNAKPSLGDYVEDLEFDVYRHLDRQGVSREGHTKVHDLYSLGVVLLEIGLWCPAINLIQDVHGKKDVTKEDMFNILHGHAQYRLTHHAGEDYKQAVSSCLESSFGITVDDSRNTQLAGAFRDLVLRKLPGLKNVR